MDVVSYMLSKSYTKKSLAGMGALKGAPCQVQSIAKVGSTTTITLKWVDNNNITHTDSFDIEDGVSVSSATINANGNLTLTLSDGTVIDCGKVLPQYDVLPTPSITYENAIFQYIGNTTSSNTNGYFYKCINDDGTYKWVNVNVQDSYTKEEIGDISLLPDNTKDIIENINDLDDRIDEKQNILQYSTLPTASADNVGVIYQYIGTNTADYTNGYYYQCKLVGTDYEWVQKNVQPNNGGSGSDNVVEGYFNSADNLFYEDALFTNPIIGSNNIIYISLDTNLLYRYDSINSIFIRVDEHSGQTIQVTTMPTASIDELNKIYQYIGNTTVDYTNGYFYKCIENSGVYSWERINIQPQITVDNALSDTSENAVQNKVIYTALNNKADKVDNATANDIATLDSDGNLLDSGISKDIIPNTATTTNKLATNDDIPTELNDLSDDVVITSPVNSQILAYNSTSGKWENQTGQVIIGSAVFKGSINFANLPTTGMVNGDWYDIKDNFTTDSRFEEGSGIVCLAGTDVIWVESDEKWNILTPSGVNSFNGRTGAVVPTDSDYDADQVDYDNTTSELSATDVQGAIDELVTEKANKVDSAVNGHLAELDANGDLIDSGVVADDVIQKVATATGLLKDDGAVDTTAYQPIELSVPIETLNGSKLTVETALNGINEDVVKTFTGTQAEWDALTTAQKQKYEICNITDDSSTDNVYTIDEVDTLLDAKMSYADNGVLGAKNLLQNKGTTTTLNGVTFTVNDDDSVTTSGTSESGVWFRLLEGADTITFLNSLESGKTYVLSGVPDSADTNIGISIWNYGQVALAHANDDKIFTKPSTISTGSSNISIGTNTIGVSFDGLTFYPMVRLADDTDDTYRPYTKTNKQLTDESKMLFPNTWAENTEIDFGNGLYGIRATGTITADASTRSEVTFATGYITGNLVSYGGYWVCGNGWKMIIGGISPYSTETSNYFQASTLFLSGTTAYFRSMDTSARTDAPYDIWMLYTKA